MKTNLSRQHRAKSFFALAHPRRLKLLEILSQEPQGLTYESLGLRSNLEKASLSHHIRFLRDANLISRHIKGRYSFYSLNPHAISRLPAQLPSKGMAQ